MAKPSVTVNKALIPSPTTASDTAAGAVRVLGTPRQRGGVPGVVWCVRVCTGTCTPPHHTRPQTYTYSLTGLISLKISVILGVIRAQTGIAGSDWYRGLRLVSRALTND